MGEPSGSGTAFEAAMVNQSVVEGVPDNMGSQVALRFGLLIVRVEQLVGNDGRK